MLALFSLVLSFSGKGLLSNSAMAARATTRRGLPRKCSQIRCVAVEGPSTTLEERYRSIRQSGALYPEKMEVIQSMEPFIEGKLGMLRPIDENWQPQDFLPDMKREDWKEQIEQLREECSELPDDLLVVIVGDTVTEEALPTYQTLLNTFEGMDDPSGTSESPWSKWSRGWTSEENRHGDLLNKFLYLSGKIDMRKMETTVQHLITTGFDPGCMKDPYRGIVYTSFQERATKISHQNVAKLCGEAGAKTLGILTTRIAGDEARHEIAYQAFMKEIIRIDPNGAIITFADMMKSQITMPAHMMTDGQNDNIFDDFSSVAQNLGVYTAIDYANIMDYLTKEFDVGSLTGLSAEAAEAQELVCNLPARYLKLAERSLDRDKGKSKINNADLYQKFSWLIPKS